jgi:hypothetical protein
VVRIPTAILYISLVWLFIYFQKYIHGKGDYQSKCYSVEEKVAGGWRTLHKLNTSQNVIGVIKSRIMRWVGHVACMAEMRNTYRILV